MVIRAPFPRSAYLGGKRRSPQSSLHFSGAILKTFLSMFRLLIYSLCTLFSISLSAQRKSMSWMSQRGQPIENVVVTDVQSGKVLGITPKNGLFLSTSQAKKVELLSLVLPTFGCTSCRYRSPRPTRLPKLRHRKSQQRLRTITDSALWCVLINM